MHFTKGCLDIIESLLYALLSGDIAGESSNVERPRLDTTCAFEPFDHLIGSALRVVLVEVKDGQLVATRLDQRSPHKVP